MKQLTSLLLVSILFYSCKKDPKVTCNCTFPFLTGNNYTKFLAVQGESYLYKNECWTYLGITKDRNDTPPSNPGQNANQWKKCGNSSKDCNTLFKLTPTWTAGIHYKGDIVKLNNKIYIAFTQGNPKPDASDDDIWAKLCE